MAANPYFMFKNETEKAADMGYVTNAYNVLRDRGQVEMELQKTFFAEGHAMLTAEFKIKWQLSCPNA